MTTEPAKPSPDAEQDNRPEGQSAIFNLYAAFGVSIILSVLPYASAALLSFFFFFGVLIAAYIIRGNTEPESLSGNHATFIIRTLWIGAFFSVITMGAATAYMMNGVDYDPFAPCAQKLADQGLVWLEQAGPIQVYGFAMPCMEGFVEANKTLFINSVIIAAGPVLLYMAYRLIKGLSRAIKGYRLAKPRVWF